MSQPTPPRYRVVRSDHQWHVTDGQTVVGDPAGCLLVAECAAAVLNRADDLKDEEAVS